MKTINDIVNWLLYGGGLTIITVFLWKYLKPLLEAKKKHAKTMQEKDLLNLVEQLSETMVNSLAGHSSMTGQDKFDTATSLVNDSLTDKDFNVGEAVIDHAVQAAYEKSPLTGQQEAKPTINPAMITQLSAGPASDKKDPVLEAIKTAPNRANVLPKEGDK